MKIKNLSKSLWSGSIHDFDLNAFRAVFVLLRRKGRLRHMHDILHSSLHVVISSAQSHSLLGRLDLLVTAVPAHVQVLNHVHVEVLSIRAKTSLVLLPRRVPDR